MADELKTGAIWDGDTLQLHGTKSDAEKTGLAIFNQHKKNLLDMLRNVYERGPKAKPFDADKAWLSLTGLAGFYFRQSSVKQEIMPAADRIKRLRDITKVLERAHDLISEAMKSDVGVDLYSAWSEANACFREGPEDLGLPLSPVRIKVFDPVRTKDKFDNVVSDLVTLKTAAAAVDVPSKKRGRRAILSWSEIWNLAALYRDSTDAMPGAGAGPFAEFIVEVLTAQGRYNDNEDTGKRAIGALKYESVIDAIKDARHWALTHPAARKWAPSPFDEE